jgi:predicted kinase
MREPFVDFVKRELGPKTILIACGLPASWKTETTEVIAKVKGYKMLRTDLIRLEVWKGEDVFDSKVASNMNKRTAVYDTMFDMADEYAAKGESVILDATFVTNALRKRAAEVAARHGMTFVIQQTHCPEEVSLGRIAKRSKEKYESNAITPEAYYNNVKKFEPVDLDDLKAQFPSLKIVHLLVDTSHDPVEQWYVIGKTVR